MRARAAVLVVPLLLGIVACGADDEPGAGEEGRTISGTVRDPDGNPVPLAPVWRMVIEGRWTASFTDEEGRYVLKDVPEGEIRLRAGGSDHLESEATERVLPAGFAGEVDFVIEPEHRLLVRLEDWAPGASGWAALVTGEPEIVRVRAVDPAGRILFEVVPRGAAHVLWVVPSGGKAYRLERPADPSDHWTLRYGDGEETPVEELPGIVRQLGETLGGR